MIVFESVVTGGGALGGVVDVRLYTEVEVDMEKGGVGWCGDDGVRLG